VTTEEKIKASIRKAIDDERGKDLGFAEARSGPFQSQTLDLTPPPLVLIVYKDGTVRNDGRPLRYMPDMLDLRREDFDDVEKARLSEQWDAALVQAAHMKRADVAIVAHATGARVELRRGPDFDPPEGGQ
jgi:hypothetical protein